MRRSPGGLSNDPGALRRGPMLIAACVLTMTLAWGAPARADLVFLPGGTFSTGAQPVHMATGDLNKDRVPDLAVANYGATSVSVMLGDGLGGLRDHVDYTVPVAPGFLDVGDFNNDGAADLVVAFPTMNFIGTLLGTGTGTIAGQGRTYTHSYTLAVAACQMDADGYLDVAVAENEYQAVDFWHGNGSGAFNWGGHLLMGGSPVCVLARDMSGDGKTDLVVVKSTKNAIGVLLGDGAGTFTPLADVASGDQPVYAAIGDFNRDGLPDVVTADYGSSTVSMFLGTGGGVLGSRQILATVNGPKGIVVADLDADGSPDVVVSSSRDNTLSIFRGHGDGTFDDRMIITTGSGPTCVLACDFNSDGRLDLASLNTAGNSVSTFLQQAPLPGTTTTLASGPNPSIVGEEVVFTATVVPSDASGIVRFFDGSTVLGETALEGGTATLHVTFPMRRTCQVWACFMGGTNYNGSCSDFISQVVHLAPTTTTAAAANTPGYQRMPCRFTAEVAPALPASGIPTGSVQFRVDGAKLGVPVVMAGGRATSLGTDSLTLGEHAVDATYIPADTLHFATSTSASIVQVIETSNPKIVKVRDVPNDQGGHVFVTWHCPLDQPGFNVVKGYRIWRRVPSLALTTSGDAGATPARVSGRALAVAADSLGPETFWEELAELPAARLVSYGFTAPTTQDSMANDNPYTAFVVQALTASDLEFFASAPDSGYSVDNLSPSAPTPFVVAYGTQSNALHWASSTASDLREFRVYRGSSATFDLSSSHLVVATRDTGYVDAPGSSYYKLVAVDVHGNVSRVVTASPQTPVALLASLVRVDALADRIGLLWYAAGNGALTATVYRREGIADWEVRAVISADGEGYLRYDDEDVEPGGRYGYRLGIVDGEGEVFLGETWVTAEQPQLHLAGVWPNPAHGNRLNVDFTLASAGRAGLQLFDVTGRQVSGRDVGDLGPGRHQVDLADGARLRPGVYLVRLTQGQQTLVARVVVVD